MILFHFRYKILLPFLTLLQLCIGQSLPQTDYIDPRLRQESFTDSILSNLNRLINRYSPESPTTSCIPHISFPSEIDVFPSEFLNWSEELKLQGIWTATPKNGEDIVKLANWAYKNNYTIRAKGFMHSWAPLTIAYTTGCSNTILVDTTKYLKGMSMTKHVFSSSEVATVDVQTGAAWEDLLTYLETNNYGVFAFPAVGMMSIGGTLAVGAHGLGLPRTGTRISSGFRSGSVSNLVEELDAIVWDAEKGEYILKTFRREDEDTRAFLVHLGRAFISRVRLVVAQNYNLRCQSFTNISAARLFGPDERSNHALINYVKLYDRVEAQYFPYTENAWLKLWTEEETRSPVSLAITKPYPYTHGNRVSRPADQLISLLARGVSRLSPVISRITFELGVLGVATSGTHDVWGPSKNSLLYYHHLSHKFISLGYNVLSSRENLQKVVSECYLFYTSLATKMSAKGKYPVNQPLEFRITGLDKTETNGNTTILPPSLSFLREVESHPEYDMAVFLGLHYFPGTKDTAEFMMEWEHFLFTTFNGQYATARVEWSKTWGFDPTGPWTNSTVYRKILPGTFGKEWDFATSTLNRYDPHNIYSNDFLKKFMQPMES